MKVHFGGTLAGLKTFPRRYKMINSLILELGHEIVRNWVDEELKDKTTTHQKMFENTKDAIKNADVVILENSFSSTSLGQQLMMALQNNLPILLLNHEDAKTDKSKGLFLDHKMSRLITSKIYNSKNIKQALRSFFKLSANKAKFSRFNLVLEKNLDNYLKEKARRKKTSKAEEIRALILKDMLSEQKHK